MDIEEVANVLEIYYENSMLDFLSDIGADSFEDIVDIFTQSYKKDEISVLFYKAQKAIMDSSL